MHPAVLVGAVVGAAALVKKLKVSGRGAETHGMLSGHQLVSGPYALWGHHLVGHGHHGHGGGGFRGFGGYSDPYAWAPLAPTCPPGYMLDAYGRCIPAVPAQVSGLVGQSSAAHYCYGRRVR
jgi:hypothetical protein